MRISFLLSTLIFLILGSSESYAQLLHYYNNASSHAGYGYLATSEIQAMADLNFDCSDVAQEVRSGVCGANVSLPGNNAVALLDSTITQFSSNIIRRTYLEHLTMQFVALGYRPGPELPLNCMRGTPEFVNYTQLQNNTAPAFSGLAIERQWAVTQGLNDESILSAFVMDEYYRSAWSAEAPACTASSRSVTCIALMNGFLKLKTAQPQLYRQQTETTAPIFPPVLRPIVAQELRPIIQTVIGPALLTSNSSDLALLRQSGAGSMHQALSGNNARGPSNLIAQMLANYRSGNQQQLLRTALSNVRASYQSDLIEQLRGVCPPSGPPVSTSEMFARDPAAVRQALLNADNSSSRTAMEYDLCHDPMFRMSRNIGCSTRCDQMTGRCESVVPREEDTVMANETFTGTLMADYPFSTLVSYGITRTPPLRRNNATIRVTIELKPSLGATPGATAATTARLQACVATWFTEQARANGMPNLNFQIQFIAKGDALPAGSPPPVSISLQTCFHSTCIHRGTDAQSKCCPGNAPFCSIPGETFHAMQEDSGNFMENITCAAVRHEIAHHLGLADEYQAAYYPFNSLGETDSIMNYSDSPAARLRPRHFWRMLHPNRCQ